MKKLLALLIIVIFGCILQSCSSGKEQGAEKGKIERMTDEAAAKITKGIKEPIDQAKKASELANQQSEEMGKQLMNNKNE